MKRIASIMLAALIVGVCLVSPVRADDAQQQPTKQFTMHPIGWVRKAQGRTTIVLDKKYAPGLLRLDQFSHVYVLYWLDRNDTPQRRSTLQVHPRGNRQNPLTGVFACRCPARPNLIALSLAKIVSVKDNVLEVERLDAFADTPVLDLKPFIPGYDSVDDAKMPEMPKRPEKNNDHES